MNRTIKFRAWNPQGHMLRPFTIGDEDTNVALILKEDWPLMQFTGLLDKNGTEVYDADVMIDHTTKIKHVVHWDEKNMQWFLSRTNDKFGSGRYPLKEARPEEQDFYDKGWERIGNIYEHPDLLSKQ